MFDRLAVLALSLLMAAPAAAVGPQLQESAFWQAEVERGDLPPVSERAPHRPAIIDMEAKGRAFGTQGGTLRTMVARSKDIRQMVVYGYARLVGVGPDMRLAPDILLAFENEGNRRFTLRLRPGHRWSDGAPFTSADFRYWWEDVAGNAELNPAGPPDFLRAGGALPRVSFPDAETVVFEWDRPHPAFPQALAQASPPFIYRPAHYLRQFHIDYADPDTLLAEVQGARVNSWAALHNKRDNMYKFDNPDLPTLQPWMNATAGKKIRHHFVRNPYFHRFDTRGVQLPYVDVVEMEIASAGLIAAKANAGEVDLQARGLGFRDVSILKKGEEDGAPYATRLWASGAASQIAIYPNLNYGDPVWRAVLRDVRVRRALSLGIDRAMINRVLYFDLAAPGAMAVLPQSPLFDPAHRAAWAKYAPDEANALLDAAGLGSRDARGIRRLPDGRPMEIVIETAGERQEEEDALQIVTDTWRDIGVKLVMRPLDRDILRNRVYAGTTMAAVWYGWDNGLPQPGTAPDYVAPRQQEFFAWPKWGQFHQTGGEAGEAPDVEEAERLMALSFAWEEAGTAAEQEAIWREMLAIHADQVFAIGILAEAPQPVVVSDRMRNVPERGMWAWDPGAHFGMYRMDEFFIADGDSDG